MKAVQLLGSAKDGGAETYFLSLIEALQTDGVAQASAVRPHASRVGRLKGLGLPVLEAGFGGPLDLITAGRIKRFARQEEAGVLIAWMNRAARSSARCRGYWPPGGRSRGSTSARNSRRAGRSCPTALSAYAGRRGSSRRSAPPPPPDARIA